MCATVKTLIVVVQIMDCVKKQKSADECSAALSPSARWMDGWIVITNLLLHRVREIGPQDHILHGPGHILTAAAQGK